MDQPDTLPGHSCKGSGMHSFGLILGLQSQQLLAFLCGLTVVLFTLYFPNDPFQFGFLLFLFLF